MLYDEELVEVSPPWSGIVLTLLARGTEILQDRSLVFDKQWKPKIQTKPLLGTSYVAEIYIDTGSRSARSTSGVEEGFILKTSVLLRYWSGEILEERILYPYSRGSPPFLLVRGDDRKRQASLYVAELAMILSMLQETPPLEAEIDGRRLIVRHGSLLQILGTYFNPIFDLERESAEAVLLYTGLDPRTTIELIRSATVKRGATEKVNPGLLAAAILGQIKREARKGNHTVIGLTEDVSRGRHLLAKVLAESIKASVVTIGVANTQRRQFNPGILLEEAVRDVRHCLEDLGISSLPHFMGDAHTYLRQVIDRSIESREDADLEDIINDLEVEDLIERIYERQILNHFNLASDSHFILLYNYFYGGTGNGELEASSTVELDKSWLYSRRFLKSYNNRLKDAEPSITIYELLDYTSGVKLRYLLTQAIPDCNEIRENAERLGIDRRLLAELIRVIPPIRVEYFSETTDISEVLDHIVSQAMVTSYGVPPQLLVVDSRSRINEWEYGALAGLLESLSRRATPYSTFIRDFSVRRHHLL
ncbi:MAG: hypothetical protein GSR77_01415 [Desulfurococcales archaeon]|nr:hypothetical protein [Desulfurococcales archaeon]